MAADEASTRASTLGFARIRATTVRTVGDSFVRVAVAVSVAVAAVGVGVGVGAGVGAPVMSSPVAERAPSSPAAGVERRPGPAASLLLVEPHHALPLVNVSVVLRSGSAWDPRKKDGLANLMAETARRGAAGRTRDQIDTRLDSLGATLDVDTTPDSIRFEGRVLSRHLDAYMAVVADILLRPDFAPAELARTRREILAALDELRANDQALCARYFVRNLYNDHPYGHPPAGDRVSLERLRREDLKAFHRQHVIGSNVVFAASGDLTIDGFQALVQRLFGALPVGAAPGPNPLAVRDPVAPTGWRIQIVDKPDRQQAQVMFGQFAVRASDPDYVPLLVAIASFGGHGMKATLMDEVRTKRGLAYGTYMNVSERIGRGSLAGWFYTANDKVVSTLKLVLRLYLALMDRGIDEERLAFTKVFLAGSTATEMDDPAHRLDARITAEIVGLPPDFVDRLPERIRAVTAAQVNAAVSRHIHARDLAITVVATAPTLQRRLLAAKVQSSAIDVVPYESY